MFQDINDTEQVKIHLNNILKKHGSLSCSKCGNQRKYVKCYLQHLRKCKEGLVSDYYIYIAYFK